MPKDWDATSVPHESILYMGASLEYSPEYEDQKPVTCEACGGVVITPKGDWIPKRGKADPVNRLSSVVVVCLCKRSNYGDALRNRGSEHIPDMKRMSHRAGRVRGKARKAG
jgi:hypothetical protein